MTNEQSFFLQILSDHLNGRTTVAQDSLDWPVLLRYAQNHQVCGIVYQQCKSITPSETVNLLIKKNATELFYYSNRVKLFAEVQNAFTAQGINFYSVKGLNVAALYPVPALRTMGDCDIVVHPEDKEKAHDVMVGLGFETHFKEDKDWMYFKNQMEFEVHDHLLYDDPGNSLESREVVDAAWEYARPTDEGARWELDWSFHFLFLLLHLKKHLINSGVGFRQFMDLAVVMQKCDLDWSWIERKLNELNLHRYAEVCFHLLNRWFDIPFPISCEDMTDQFLDKATVKVFANGIFGFDDESNKESRDLNALTQRHGPRWLVRILSIIASVFPPYRNMRFSSHYTFLDGRPWLLPSAWIYRFYRAIRYRMGADGKRMIERSLISNERLDERERELEMWGLRGR